jgi:hypothetical protein
MPGLADKEATYEISDERRRSIRVFGFASLACALLERCKIARSP